MKQDIEYAALVMGITLERSAWVTIAPDFMYQLNMDGSKKLWEFRPLHDDGDSRRLEIACMSWCEGHIITVPESVERAVSEVDRARRSGNREWYRCSVFDLAVAIGKVISAGDAIDGGGV
jgi:hypothetical protein